MNIYKIKKWVALFLVGALPIVTFLATVNFYDMLIALGATTLSIIFCMYVAGIFLKTPFSAFMEGDGLMVWNMDSKGLISTFLCSISGMTLRGRKDNKEIQDIYNREHTVFDLKPPVQNKDSWAHLDKKTGNWYIKVDAETFRSAKMLQDSKPTLIWNDLLGSFLTKDFFSKQEKGQFTEHTILSIRDNIFSLDSKLAILTRTFADVFSKKFMDILKHPMTWIFLLILAIVGVVMFAPDLIPALGDAVGNVGDSVSSVSDSASETVVRQ